MFVQGIREKWAAFRRWLPLALSTLAVAALLLLFNWVVAGGPLVNPYLLVFPFDRLGFGSAVGPGGHAALDALVNLGSAALLLSRDLLGWLWLSWLGVVVALLLPVRSWRDWALAAPFVGLLLAHTLYWYAGLVPYGSRYQYEGVPLLWLLTAVGVEKLDRRLSRRGRRATAVVLTILVLSNLVVVLPARIEALHGLYGVTRGWFAPVDEADLHQALVLCMGEHWRDCGSMYGRMDPFAQGEVVYARSCSPGEDAALMAAMPGRTVYRFDGETLELVRLRDQPP
jgi:hypothetical protein